MRVRAQVSMVMNLDKCIGCHTCSVTCKNVWSNRRGTEYMWWNDVETKPGVGYPKRWEDQGHWRGGWALDRKGRLRLRAGGKLPLLFPGEQGHTRDLLEVEVERVIGGNKRHVVLFFFRPDVHAGLVLLPMIPHLVVVLSQSVTRHLCIPPRTT